MNQINSLEGKIIFISASFPQQDRDEIYFKGTYPLNITDAVLAVTRGIFNQKGKVVFGGHPTISPLILSIGTDFLSIYDESELPFVYIYQSKLFEKKISEYTQTLVKEKIGEIRWVEAVENNREKTLEKMRRQMLEETSPIAGIFIGGMEGIIEEFNLFMEIFPRNPLYPLGSTGGAARQLFERQLITLEKWEFEWHYDLPDLFQELKNSNTYPSLTKKILKDLSLKDSIFSQEVVKPSIIQKIAKPLIILVAHDNKIEYQTIKAHKFAEQLDKNPNFKTIFDEKVRASKENISRTEINKREKEMIKEADVITRIVPPESITGQRRSIGVLAEIRKAIHAGKPIIEIFERGARDSPKRPLIEKNYKKRVAIHLQLGEPLSKGFKRGLDELKKKKILDIPDSDLSDS